MSSNFYTNSYLKNHEETNAKRDNQKKKIGEIQALLPEILKEMKQIVYRLDSIEKAVNK